MIKGHTFDRVKVQASEDAALYQALAGNISFAIPNYLNGLTVRASGLNVYVNSGRALVQGRFITNLGELQLTVPPNSFGYVCIVIDLSRPNTATGDPHDNTYQWVNNQCRFDIVANLVEGDLQNGAMIHTFPLYSYYSTSTVATVTKITDHYLNSFNFLVKDIINTRNNAYTKAESDNIFARKDNVWTMSEAENRYAVKSSGSVIWSGDAIMVGNTVITPSATINECANGWMLVWGLDTGTDYYAYTPLYKFMLRNSALSVSMAGKAVNTGVHATKVLTISTTGTTLSGSDFNADINNTTRHLKYIINF